MDGVALRFGVEPIPFIDVVVGDESASFLLDTGATVSSVSPELAERHGFGLGDEAMTGFSGLGGEYEYRLCDVSGLTVAGIKLKPLVVQAHDLDALSEVAGERVSGVLGHDALADHVVTIDYVAHRFSLLAPRRVAPTDAIPFDYGPSGAMVLIVDGLVNDELCARLVVDSGSSVVVLAEQAAIAVDARLIAELREGYPEDFPHWWTTIDALQVGSARRASLEAIVYDLAAFNQAIGVQFDGVVGHPFLSQGVLEIDYPNQVLRIT